MKMKLRKIFWFILQFFEKGNEPFHYKPINRKILIVVGILFTALSFVTIYLSFDTQGYGFLIPVVVFFAVGFVTITVGLLGSDRAVSKMWGNR